MEHRPPYPMIPNTASTGPVEPEEEERESCARPGPRGCWRCEACADWGDMKYHEKVDQEMEDKE